MINEVIAWSARQRWIVFGGTLLLALWAIDCLRRTPIDVLPDRSEPEVIVSSVWPGRGPELIEDQITYPLVGALQDTPGVRTVRGYSMFGMSFVHAIFADGTDRYWARSRVLEQIGRARQALPEGVTPELGPDASNTGWIFQYVLEDRDGRLDAVRLRALQDVTVRPALQAVPGVAEVASLGGAGRQYQVLLDPDRLAAYGLSLTDITRAVRDANAEVGARVLELAGREFMVRGRGYLRTRADLEGSVVGVGAGGSPIRLRDVATVRFAPDVGDGAADWNGTGDAVGGIVVMRSGGDARDVIRDLQQRIATLALPDGVHLVPTYDRSILIEDSITTLRTTLIRQGVIVLVVCLVFLMHVGAALVALIILPLSVLLSFVAIRYLGLGANILSLGGIALAIGELSGATFLLIEHAYLRIAREPRNPNRQRMIVEACQEVGRPIAISLLLVAASFVPMFMLSGQADRWFAPLAYLKTVALFVAAILLLTLAPPLLIELLTGRVLTSQENPVQRRLARGYASLARWVVRRRVAVVILAAVMVLATVPVWQRLGSEFMPPLDEGSLLVLPATFPGISIEEARRALNTQSRVILDFPEVAAVHGKAGRAATATDQTQLDMNEITVRLKPRSQWPAREIVRWHSAFAPEFVKPLLREFWPERRPRTSVELMRDLDAALRMPGYRTAIAPPIRARIDLRTNGIRTPVGIKVFGEDLAEIERLSIAIEGLLREVPGTRGAFAERQTGREYVDIVPDRDAIARYGLTMREVLDVVAATVGGMPVSTVIDGRARYPINLRYAAEFRSDPEALRRILVSVPAIEPVAVAESRGAGRWAAAAARLESDSAAGRADPGDAIRPLAPTVPLGTLAQVHVVTGPPMIKDEDGVRVGYVFADIDGAERDLGGWIEDAKRRVAERVALPAGYRLQWTGESELLASAQARLRIALPITIVLFVALLYLAVRGVARTLLVLLGVPFAVAGGVWLLRLLDYNLSPAVWAVLLAVAGIAAQAGIMVIVFLDQACAERRRAGGWRVAEDVDAAVSDGCARCPRPMLMLVAATVLGLMPLLRESGAAGADLFARGAAAMIGGLLSCLLLTLLVLPAMYAIWRRRELARTFI